MRLNSSRKSTYFFALLGVVLVALAIALNVGWIVLNWREAALLIFGAIFFLVIIAGLVLNTIFLVREIRRNEQHDSFINAVTHELKTPIASIRLYLETLQTRAVDEARRREFYQIMLEDSDRLLYTVEQVLRASRAGHKGRQLYTSVIDLAEMARDCTELTRTRMHLAPEALRFVEPTNADAALLVRGDAEELRAAVTNLIDNAIKYSPQRIDVQVEVVRTDEKRVAVRVSDQGVGIPRAQLKQIFKRFYRIPRRVTAKVKGTGLGLFIVRSVASKHGGRAYAESAGEGLGSTFVIELPRIG